MVTQFRKGTLTRLVETVVEDLPERHKEVLERRYGMNKDGEKETLEAIGEDFDITRERVRQIENAGFGMLKKSGAKKQAEDTFRSLAEHLDNLGSLRREERLLEELALSQEQGHLLFLLDLGDPFSRHHERDWHWSIWTSQPDARQRADQFLKSFCRRLAEHGKALPENEFVSFAKDFCARQDLSFHEPTMWSYVDASKAIERGPFGEWGLIDWPDVAPRGVRDRAYLVLKREGKPLHFRNVADSIGKLAASKQSDLEWPRPNIQTVHNELLKDERFVLIGRGLYALREWGYEPGTVRDIIVAVLEDSGKPLTREELLDQVLERRQVKPTTILLNLHNKKHFERTADGRYTVRS